MSFNVLAFGDPAVGKRTLIGDHNEIMPVDASLISALTSDVTRSMLGDGAVTSSSASREQISGYSVTTAGEGGSRRGSGDTGRNRPGWRDGSPFSRKNFLKNASLSRQPVLPANGATRIGFDSITLTGKDTSQNVFAVSASDLALASRVAVKVPTTSKVVINVMGMENSLSSFPNIVGAAAADVLINMVSADNSAIVNSDTASTSKSSLSANSGQYGTGVVVASIAGTNSGSTQDPIGAFGAASGGSGAGAFGSASGGQTGGGKPGGGVINPASPPPIIPNSVLPESSGLLLLSFGLMGLLPLARRRR